MREINFRAWDRDKKQMFVVGAVTFHDEKFGIAVDDTAWNFRENSDLMQYTGLKDKNGKEIYEGDVIWYTIKLASAKYMGEVVFDEAGFNLESPLANELLPLYGADRIEIIGNIYENPELIKEEL